MSVFHTFLITNTNPAIFHMKLGQHDIFVLDILHHNDWSVYMSRSAASHSLSNSGTVTRDIARKIKLLCMLMG